jgi:hypothetical protein
MKLKSFFALLIAVGSLTLFSFTTTHKTQLVKNQNGSYTITPAVKLSDADIKLLVDNTVTTDLGSIVFSKLITRQETDAQTQDTKVSVIAQDVAVDVFANAQAMTQKQRDVVGYILSKY